MPTGADRLDVLYEVNRRLATFTDLAELLRYATRRTRELFDAEGCALLLLDADRRELSFPVASQSEARPTSASRLAEIRFPADRGIAGWVVAHDEAALVNDVTKDERFYPGVDRETDITTRAVLCAPLKTDWGTIGAIEVVNPSTPFRPEDLAFLQALAGDIAVAHEKVALQEQLTGEILGLRGICSLTGTALLVAGTVSAIAATLVHLAVAKPLAELPFQPGFVLGIAGIAAGLVLVGIGRGWIVARSRPARLGPAGPEPR
jgi:GAF domain-containing protein